MSECKIYWDNQDKNNEGWAYAIDGGESGGIDDRAAKVLNAMSLRMPHDDGALRGFLARQGIDPADVVFYDEDGQLIGNPWPDVGEWREYGGDSECGPTWFPADDGIFDGEEEG
jgi:hypothetical protein